jgi:UDP-glucose 4-epimerase
MKEFRFQQNINGIHDNGKIMMKTILVTGGAGFIGSHVIARLLKEKHIVICVDNLTLGKKENISNFFGNKNFFFYEADISAVENCIEIARNHKIDSIFHLAANSDIQLSAKLPEIDYKNTFSTTYSVLECMRQMDIRKLFFASTSAVYGEQPEVNLSETAGSLLPISYYGGAKLASEAFISSYSYMNNLDVTIFRFPNVIGPSLTHGVVFDFIQKLQKNSTILEILGDGTQHKPYIYIDDLIEAIMLVALSDEKGMQIYNVGVEGTTSVKEIADMVCEKLGLQNVQYHYSGGNRGWKGDVPTFQYNLTKIHKRGWKALYNSNQAVQATLDKTL